VHRQALGPSALMRPGQLRLRSRDELEEEQQVALADLGWLLAQREQLSRVFTDRLEKQETALADRLEEAPVHQSGDLVEIGSGDDLRGFDGETAGEHGEPAESTLEWLLQQLVAPGDSRAQRLLSLRRVASSSGKHWQAPGQALQQERRVEHLYAGRGKLKGQGKPVETLADPYDRGVEAQVALHRSGTLEEELNGLVRREWVERVLLLAGDPQAHAARHEHPQ